MSVFWIRTQSLEWHLPPPTPTHNSLINLFRSYALWNVRTCFIPNLISTNPIRFRLFEILWVDKYSSVFFTLSLKMSWPELPLASVLKLVQIGFFVLDVCDPSVQFLLKNAFSYKRSIDIKPNLSPKCLFLVIEALISSYVSSLRSFLLTFIETLFLFLRENKSLLFPILYLVGFCLVREHVQIQLFFVFW